MRNRRARVFGDLAGTPVRRDLKIFASDPMLQRHAVNRITINIPNERGGLRPGPVGEQFAIIDYDADHDRFYRPVDLNDPAILMQNGLDPSESDPRFHQQMVYAVAMRTLENLSAALGRPLSLRRREQPLRLLPHAFHGANAFYHRRLHAIMFGYFRADMEHPGRNLPGQMVFTCLSHDIIVHELTHAVVHRLRPAYFEPSNQDVLAFHEGFSDIVALFQRFTFQELLREELLASRTRLEKAKLLVDMAQQFGYATGAGKALRSAIDDSSRTLYKQVVEPHERGAILVAAVFDAFHAVYQGRIRDLIRIATGGSGQLPDGDLHPDLINRVAAETSRTAQSVLNMCIRAFDYLPPVDVTFGDYLRALVTADFELNGDDPYGQRAAMIEAFRQRGIYAEDAISLAEESLVWEPAERPMPRVPTELLKDLIGTTWSVNVSPADGPQFADKLEVREKFSMVLHKYAKDNAKKLHLDQNRGIAVSGFHWGFRVGRTGQLLIDFIVQFMQTDPSQRELLGGLPFRGGTTVVAAADGTVRYVIAKPIGPVRDSVTRAGSNRFERQVSFVNDCDQRDRGMAWHEEEYLTRRMAARMNLAAIHRGLDA
jgi:hypothetical protein